MAALCIDQKLPLTILRTKDKECKLISFLTHKLIHSKTAGMIVEGRIIDRESFKPTEERILLTEANFLGACLGFELAEN